MKTVRLGIAGLGTVAQGVLKILGASQRKIAARSGVRIEVVRVASRTPKPEVDLLGAAFSVDLDTVLADDVDVVVELIGGEGVARSLIESALAAGKGVVTANKAVIANHGNQLFARDASIPLKFEASVAGAIPIVQAVQQGLVANENSQIVGIINGTCNYILTSMQEQGAAFNDALDQAQTLGYAEADPTFDVEGIDAGHKLAILAGLAFDCEFDFDALHIEGIRQITSLDIKYAQELGYRIKHVGIAKRQGDALEARVHPALIPQDALFANVNGVTNAVLVNSDAAGQTLFSGPGAGGSATASAVVADIVALGHFDATAAIAPRQPAKFLPINEVVCANYLRIPVLDEPGVFAKVAGALSTHDISIEAAIQKESQSLQPQSLQSQSLQPQRDAVSIVIVTGDCQQSTLQKALNEVRQLPQMAGEISRIRLENLD